MGLANGEAERPKLTPPATLSHLLVLESLRRFWVVNVEPFRTCDQHRTGKSRPYVREERREALEVFANKLLEIITVIQLLGDHVTAVIMSVPAILLHCISASIMLWGYTQLDTLVSDVWIQEQTGGHWQFLTVLG